MRRRTALLLSILVLYASSAAGHRDLQETLAAFVGEWRMDLAADPATFGNRGGPGTGTMACQWGPLQAWVECTLTSDYQNMGRYALKIVLYRHDGAGNVGAFVTNSFGGGRLYVGRWQSDTELVYHDAWIDPNRTWPHQRTTYQFPEDGTIEFAIDVSRNGETWLPHSTGRYHPD